MFLGMRLGELRRFGILFCFIGVLWKGREGLSWVVGSDFG